MKRDFVFNMLLFALVLLTTTVSITSMRRVSALESRIVELQALTEVTGSTVDMNLKSLYLLSAQKSSRLRTIMNMLVRNYHYLAEHTDTKNICPECYAILEREGEIPLPSKE
jgi:hypothetical protein